MKKVCNRNMLFAAILCLQLNVVAAFGQTVVKGSVKDNTGKPVSGVVVTDGAHFNNRRTRKLCFEHRSGTLSDGLHLYSGRL